jgi:ABC-type dipeptide/oligopeptide/nickel transport system permease subunit
MAILALLLLGACWPLAWLPNDPLAQDLLRRLEPPSQDYWLGTDMLGRCLFSRVAAGATPSLGAALLVAGAICCLALAWGLAASLGGRHLDAVLMRTADVLLGFPTLVLALALIGVAGASLPVTMGAMVIAWTPGLARVVRSLTRQALTREFVLAAKLAGLGQGTIVRRHVLPQLMPPLLVLASLEAASVLLALSSLSFLGLGAQPPSPEWGVMLNEARPFMMSAPHLLIGPGVAVVLATLGLNLLGEGLRERFDQRQPLRW